MEDQQSEHGADAEELREELLKKLIDRKLLGPSQQLVDIPQQISHSESCLHAQLQTCI